jgi:hypothetical protein
MPTTFIVISACFTVYSVVLCWLIINSGEIKMPLIAKAALTTWLVAMSVALAFSFGSMMGYPVDRGLPSKILLVSAHIKEPDKSFKGAIYIWGEPDITAVPWWKLFVYNTGRVEPRSYHLPYTKEAHKKMEQAMEDVKQGRKVYLEGNGGKKEKGEGEASDGSGGDKKGSGDSGKAKGKETWLGSGGRKTAGEGDDWSKSYEIIIPELKRLNKD